MRNLPNQHELAEHEKQLRQYDHTKNVLSAHLAGVARVGLAQHCVAIARHNLAALQRVPNKLLELLLARVLAQRLRVRCIFCVIRSAPALVTRVLWNVPNTPKCTTSH